MFRKYLTAGALITISICLATGIGMLAFNLLPIMTAKAAFFIPHTPKTTPPALFSQPLPSLTPTPFLPSTFTPKPSATPTATPTPTPIPPTPTLTPTNTEIPPTETPQNLPESAYITNIFGKPQIANLDCESRTAVDLAAWYGVAIPEEEFINRLPISDNPDEGFVGSIHGSRGQIPPAAYGVHAYPIAGVLREYGLNASDYRNLDLTALQTKIAAGQPVMVWVIGQVWEGQPIKYQAADGKISIVAHWEHTVMVIGYSPSSIRILDGAQIYDRNIASFLSSWAVLGNMAVMID